MSDQRQQSGMATASSPDSTPIWCLNAAGSHAELTTRHWFWGRNAFTVTPAQGQTSEMSEQDARFMLEFRVVTNKRESVGGSIRAQHFTKIGYARFEALAEIEVDGCVTQGKLLLADYGSITDGQVGARRFGVISMRLSRDFLAQGEWSWRRMLIGPHADLYAHLEWRLPDATSAQFTKAHEKRPDL